MDDLFASDACSDAVVWAERSSRCCELPAGTGGRRISHVAVRANGRLCGLVTLVDVLRNSSEQAGECLVAGQRLPTVDESTPLDEVDRLMRRTSDDAVLVGAADDGITGVITRESLLKALLEQQADRHRAELAHRDRLSTVGQMTARLIHELTQPLGAVLSYAAACQRLLRARAVRPHELGGAIEGLVAQARRAAELIRQTRSFAKPSRHSPVAVNDLVQEVVQSLAVDVYAGRVNVGVKLAPGLPALVCDPAQIHQLVVNLIRNAIEALAELEHDDRRVTIRTSLKQKNTIQIDVSDNGPGLPAGVDGQIFRPFFTTKREGMGLGLAICQSIVEAHGGDLRAANRSGRGARFSVRLPLPARGRDRSSGHARND